MGGFFWHLIHGYETYTNIPESIRRKMPYDALRNIIIGAIVPDLAKGENKAKTHFYINHPIYGDSYLIPNMKIAEKLFLKKNPVYLGVYSHLKYDLDHTNRFLMVYAKPCGDGMYENTTTGEKLDEITLFGDWNEVYGQLYQFYDKFNSEMVREYVPKLNEVFETDFPSNNEGFLALMKWLFPKKMPQSGIPEMDNYRTTDDIHRILQGYFNDDGSGCKFNADLNDIMTIVHESAVEFSKQVERLYESD